MQNWPQSCACITILQVQLTEKALGEPKLGCAVKNQLTCDAVMSICLRNVQPVKSVSAGVINSTSSWLGLRSLVPAPESFSGKLNVGPLSQR